MKFSCDSCGASYMISDEKVGPNGVRVRCKKCGNQITVRRAGEAPAVPVLERSAPAEAPGLDEELGSAFDNAFGDQPVAAVAAAADPAPAPLSAAVAPAPLAQEWYVAIGEAQVGPLPLVEVRKRWEAGDIGPDSLVWRPGMAEWGPLSSVAELAAFLAPVPQPSAPSAAPAASVFAAPGAAQARQVSPQARPAATATEVEWKPSGARALAELANEELATRGVAPAEKPVPARSVMEQLPDSGGVDPTGAIPLPIKALERTGERPVRRSSVARGAEELRHKRTVRTVVFGALLGMVVFAGGVFAWFQFSAMPAAPAAVVAAPAPAPPPAVAPPPAADPVAAGNALAATPADTNAVAVAAPAPGAPTAPVKAAEVTAPKKGKAPPPAAARPVRPPVAQAAPAAPPARPAAEKPAAKKKDGLLDFDQGGDDDLAAALGTGSGGRKVYVPPATGAGATPDRLGDGQIMESVKLHSDALRRCVGEQHDREPGVKGTLKLAWVILADGNPRDVRCITPEYAQGEFAKCMIGVVRGIRFARVGDPKGQPVTFPFQF